MNDTASLSLAYSPCPNDTYIFAAWTQGLLADAPPVRVVLDDVEALNSAAKTGQYALTKVSYGAIPSLLGHYRILRSGGALGRGCGPLVVVRPNSDGTTPALAALGDGTRFAIPGRMTTAYLLLRLAVGAEVEAVPMRFDRIVAAVAGGEVDAGLIIHESRFTYAQAGLRCAADLGAWWEATTGLPIPLGAILVRHDLAPELLVRIDPTIRASLAFARANPTAIAPYIREHAFEMDESVMHAHIALYVNDYSDDIGSDGIAAVTELFDRAAAAGLVPMGTTPIFA
ncbi:MAG TPA: 1,4-dihydroxy-6-naphthoate synthase [Candidatus Acidoferrales bacterium]|nr:1,4-dihydroxy-6-naphthoate synthase [Candidatus Acidoferrales bacterium]